MNNPNANPCATAVSYVQSEDGGQAEPPSADSIPSTGFETCLKIRGVGVDTAGALDALGSVLWAASAAAGGEEKTSAEEGGEGEVVAKKPDVPTEDRAEAMVEAHDAEVGPGEGEQHASLGASTVPVRGDTHRDGDVDPSNSETEKKSAEEEMTPAAASTSPPAVWSLEFAYSELERVLEALETAVSGLVFVVGATASQEADLAASTLW